MSTVILPDCLSTTGTLLPVTLAELQDINSMPLVCGVSLPKLLAHHPTPQLPVARTVPVLPHTTRRAIACHAATDLAKFANKSYLDKAAQRFKIGMLCPGKKQVRQCLAP